MIASAAYPKTVGTAGRYWPECRYSRVERSHEIGLRRGVRLSIIPMLGSEASLEALIARCSLSIRAHAVTKGKPVTPYASAMYHHVEMMRAPTIGPAHEPLSVGQRCVELGRR
jgi:hypothetical protein